MRPAFSKSKKRSSFAPEEADKLRDLVQKYDEENWYMIAAKMPKRQPMQVRER